MHRDSTPKVRGREDIPEAKQDFPDYKSVVSQNRAGALSKASTSILRWLGLL